MQQFDQDTAVNRVADDRWQGVLTKAWNIGDNPNGGYLLSMVLAALRDALPHRDPVSVTTHYLRPGSSGEACDIQVTVLRRGRTVSSARATLLQAGKARLEVLAMFGELSQSVGVDRQISTPAPPIPLPDACVPRSGETQGLALAITQRLDVRLDPALAEPAASDTARIAGWVRFKDGRAPDTLALPLFTDTFAPSTVALLGVVGWVPTLELTVQVRRVPAPGWIQAEFICQDLHHGRMIESGMLWDSQGQLVAQSRQTGLVLQQQ